MRVVRVVASSRTEYVKVHGWRELQDIDRSADQLVILIDASCVNANSTPLACFIAGNTNGL